LNLFGLTNSQILPEIQFPGTLAFPGQFPGTLPPGNPTKFKIDFEVEDSESSSE